MQGRMNTYLKEGKYVQTRGIGSRNVTFKRMVFIRGLYLLLVFASGPTSSCSSPTSSASGALRVVVTKTVEEDAAANLTQVCLNYV